MNARVLAIILLLGASLLSYRAAVAQTGQQVAVTGDVTGGCNTLSPASGTLAFGSYDVFGGVDVTAGPLTFTIRCTKNDPNFNVAVSGGSNYSHASPSGDRAMVDSKTTYLTYQLYQSSGTSSPWAFSTSNGTGTAVAETANGINTNSTFSLYGIIPHGQTLAAGPGVSSSFSDSVTVTVNF
jgi:spore coat protein U-like protein